VKIYNSDVEFATGEWVLISMSSQGSEIEYHQGLTSTNSKMTTTEKAKSLETSISVENKFFIGKTKVSVKGSISEDIKSEVDSSKSYSTDTTLHIKCDPPAGSEYGSSLYQWQVYNDEVRALTKRLICRTGETWNSAPKCPPSACVDAICSECLNWMA